MTASEPVGRAAGLTKRSLAIAGHRTSVALEPSFWSALEAIAAERGTSLPGLVASIDATATGGNLTSRLRVFVLDHFRRKAEG